ncbi:MAG: thioesterase family protein [Planctomycetota bacterium]
MAASDTPLYRARRTVDFRDTDAAGIVHFSVFFQWMESAEHEFLRSLGLSVMPSKGSTVEELAVTWPRVSANCDYRSALRFEDAFEIDVFVDRIGNSSLTYRFEFLRDDESIATGKITAVCCRLLDGGHLEKVAVPDVIKSKLMGG